MTTALRAVMILVLVGSANINAATTNFLGIVRRYADTMIERGRDVYGPQKTGLLLSAMNRSSLTPLDVRPAPPGGIRRGDRTGRAWAAMQGANLMKDENLLRVLYSLSEVTGDARYARAADEEITWFFQNAMSPATSLLPWGEHLSWDVTHDIPISGGDEMMHEYARPWVLWEKCFKLVPNACMKFAMGLWEHQIANHTTGGFDRHAPFFEHGPVDGRDFPRHAGFYIGTWCYAWKHSTDEVFLKAIETLLARFERKRVQKDGSLVATIGPLECELAAAMVPEALAKRLRAFAEKEDELIMARLRGMLRGEKGVAAPPKWQAGYAASTLANKAMFCLARFDQVQKPEYRELLVSIADAYQDARPEEDVDTWPMSFAHVISMEIAAWRFTGKQVYLQQAETFGAMAVELFWQDNPLPRASQQTGHYETITGGDSLALALLELDAAMNARPIKIPLNTIDR